MRIDNAGLTVWLTGLPSAGKTTLARALQLAASGPVEHLDGDEVRPWLSGELGFSRADRATHVRRVGRIACLLGTHGAITVVSLVSPYRSDRAWVRAFHTEMGVPYAEVHVATRLRECELRDVKGLYARARRGEIAMMSGVDDPYEEPLDPDVVVDETISVDRATELVAGTLARRWSAAARVWPAA